MDEHRRYARELVSGGQDEALEKALDMIRNADRIVIGGGAGLSACGGLNYMSLEVNLNQFLCIFHSSSPACGKADHRVCLIILLPESELHILGYFFPLPHWTSMQKI